MEKVRESARRGWETVEMDRALYRAFVKGKGDPIETYRNWLGVRQQQGRDPITGEWIGAEMLYGGANVGAGMGRAYWESKGTIGAMGLAGAAIGTGVGLALGGPTGEEPALAAGGARALPWLARRFAGPLAGAKTGTKLGLLAGAGKFWYEQGAGEMIGDMLQMGLDPVLACKVASVAALPYMAIEFIQVKQLTPFLRRGIRRAAMRGAAEVLEKAARTGWGTVARRVGGQYGKTLIHETSEEVLQQAVQISAREVVAYLDGQGVEFNAEKLDRWLEELGATAKQAAISMALLPAGGAMQDVAQGFHDVRVATALRGAQQEAARAEAEAEETVARPPAPELPPGLPGDIARIVREAERGRRTVYTTDILQVAEGKSLAEMEAAAQWAETVPNAEAKTVVIAALTPLIAEERAAQPEPAVEEPAAPAPGVEPPAPRPPAAPAAETPVPPESPTPEPAPKAVAPVAPVRMTPTVRAAAEAAGLAPQDVRTEKKNRYATIEDVARAKALKSVQPAQGMAGEVPATAVAPSKTPISPTPAAEVLGAVEPAKPVAPQPEPAPEPAPQGPTAEQARTDAGKITAGMLVKLRPLASGGFNTSVADPFVQDFVASVPAAERDSLLTHDRKTLSDDGDRRMKAAVLARVYGSTNPEHANALLSMVETGGRSENIRNIVNGLMTAAGNIGKVKGLVEAGVLDQSYDLAYAAGEGVQVLRRGREVADANGISLSGGISTFAATPDLFGRKVSKPGVQIARVMAEKMRSAKAIGDYLNRVAKSLLQPAMRANQNGLPGLGVRPTLSDLLESGAYKGKRGKQVQLGEQGAPVAPAAPANLPNWPKRAEPYVGKQVAGKLNNRAIVRIVEKALGVPIRTGGIKSRRARGVYRMAEQMIRTKRAYDLPATAHEVGHHLDNLFAWSSNLTGAQALELGRLGQELYPSYKGQRLWAEGIAAFTAAYVNDPQQAQRLAPEFTKTWDATLQKNPQIREAVETFHDLVSAYTSMTPQQKIAAHMVKSPLAKQDFTLGQRIRRLAWSFMETMYDEWTVSSAIEKQMTAAPVVSKSPTQMAYLYTGMSARGDSWILPGGRGQQDYTTREVLGKTLGDICAPVADQMDTFDQYMAAKHSLTWAKLGQKVPWSEAEAQDLVTQLGTPLFKKTAAEVTEYSGRLAQYWEDAGGLRPGTVAMWKEKYPDYVPFFRMMEAIEVAGEGLGKGAPFKSVKGVSERPVVYPSASIITQTYRVLHAAEKNRIMRNWVDIAAATEGSGTWVSYYARKMKATQGELAEIRKALTAQFGEDAVDMADLSQTFALWRASSAPPKPHTLGVWIGGAVHYYEFEPMLARCLSRLDGPQASILTKAFVIAGIPTRMLKAGIVLSLPFMVRNIIRDLLGGFIHNDYQQALAIPTISGFFDALGHGQLKRDFMASGAAYSTFSSVDIVKRPEVTIERMTGKGKTERVAGMALHPVRSANLFSETFEQATRLGTFASVWQANKLAATIDRLCMAGRQAQEATVNFSRMGTLGRYLNMIFPFFNPSIQGLVRTMQSAAGFKNVPVFGKGKAVRWSAARMGRFWTRTMATIGTFSLMAYLVNRRDPAYWELDARDRDLYWHIPLRIFGGPEAHYIRIPKPFEIGVGVGSSLERMFRYIDSRDPQAFDELVTSIWNIAAPTFTPTVAAPWLENWGNRSFFWDSPIVPRKLEGAEAFLQYRPSTTELAKVLGKAFGYSPAKLENFIRGYSSTLGMEGLRFLDWTLQAVKILPEGTSRARFRGGDAATWPILSNFIQNSLEYSASIGEFYTKLSRADTATQTARMLAGEEKIAYMKAHRAEIIGARRLRRANADIGKFREARMRADNNTNLDPEERRRIVRLYDLRILNRARMALRKKPLDMNQYMPKDLR